MFRFPKARPTMADKLRTCTSRDELDAMVDDLTRNGVALSDEEQQAVAHCKIELARKA